MTQSATAQHRHSTSSAYRPLWITLLLTTFVLVMVETAIFTRQQALAELQWHADSDLNRYMLTLQQRLDRYKDLPQLLATHSQVYKALQSSVTDAEIQRTNRYLQQVNTIIGTTDTYLMRPDGTTIAASNWQADKTFIGRNFNFRPYFQDAMEGKAGRYFALGTTSRQRGYYFSYPVREGKKILGVLVVKIDLHDVEEHWSNPQMDLLVTDADGIIFISTRPEWKFKSLRPLSGPDLQRIAGSLRYGSYSLSALDVVKREPIGDGAEMITLLHTKPGTIQSEAFDGVEPRQYVLQDKTVPGFGLSVSVLASMKPVEEAMWEMLLLVGFSFAALVLLVLFLMARRRIKNERMRFQQRELQALEQNESRVRAIIDNTRAGLIMLDASGSVESVNPTAEVLFGYSAETIRGQYFSQLLASQDRAACWRHILADESQTPALLSMEATGIHADGGCLPIELNINRMMLDQHLYFIVTVHDLTERKRYETQLKSAQEALETRVQERTSDLSLANAKLLEEMQQHRNTQNELIQTAKLAVIGQMSAGINHELNQPLTAIRNYADNARAFLERQKFETVDSNLQEISSLTERMSRIIHPLKEFSRKSSDQNEPVCLQALRDGAMSLMYGRMSKSHVDVSWPAHLAEYYVHGDILRLEQVLVNLLSNALQAMEHQEQRKIEVSVDRTNAWLRLHVRDYGPGIAQSDLERIFEPFFTTKKSGQGLGLGLSISHRIVDTMGGHLTAANHPEGGAVFTIELAVATAPDNFEMKRNRNYTGEYE